MSATPASTATPGQALPLYGTAVADRSLAAAGGILAVSTLPGGLFVSTDAGSHWTPLPQSPGTLDPLILSPGGHLLAGSTGQSLDLLRLRTPGGTTPTWVTRPAQNLTALAFDTADSHLLAGLGAETGSGHLVLYTSTDGGTSLATRVLPATIGHGDALVVRAGTVVVAAGQAGGTVQLFSEPLAGSAVPVPQPPAAATSPVFDLVSGPAGTLYLATAGGLFALPARGQAWAEIPLPSGVTGSALVYVSATSSQLYVTADDTADQGTLWRGSKSGGGWQRIPMPPGFLGQPVGVGTQVWVPSDAGPVLIGTSAAVRADGIPAQAVVVASAAWRPTQVAAGGGNGLYFSGDGGRNWTEGTPPGSPTTPLSQVVWTPDGGCVAVIRAGSGLSVPEAYLSDNAGRSWWHVPLPGAGWVTAMTESPPGSGIWWVTESGKTPGLYRSTSGRAIWTKVDMPAGAAAPLHLAPATSGVWVSGLSFGAWQIRIRQGLAGLWDRLLRRPPPTPALFFGAGSDQSGAVSAQPLVADPYDTAVVYNGLRRTLDGGGTWELVPPGTSGVVPEQTTVEALTFAPGDPGALLVTPQALYRDDGAAWVTVWRAPAGQRITAAAPAGPGRFYVAVSGLGVIVVADSGATWQPPATPPGQGRWVTPAPGSPPTPLTIAAPSAPGTVYRLSGGTLAVSRDGGKTFPTTHAIALPGGLACCTSEQSAMGAVVASTLAVSPTDPRRVYVGLEIEGIIATQGVAGLWISDNAGVSWQRSGMPARLSVEDLAAVPGSGDTLYAAAYSGFASGTPALWRSTDGGASWAQVATLPGPVYSVTAPTATEVLAGGAGRIWRSTDAAQTFASLPLELPIWKETGFTTGGLPVEAVLQAGNGTLFAATGLGVARSQDTGHSWQVISEPVGDPPVLPGGLKLRADGALAVATEFGTFVYGHGPTG